MWLEAVTAAGPYMDAPNRQLCSFHKDTSSLVSDVQSVDAAGPGSTLTMRFSMQEQAEQVHDANSWAVATSAIWKTAENTAQFNQP